MDFVVSDFVTAGCVVPANCSLFPWKGELLRPSETRSYSKSLGRFDKLIVFMSGSLGPEEDTCGMPFTGEARANIR